MVKKETYTREEVIEMLKEMQMETSKCVGFIVGMVTQGWVIKVMLGQRIMELEGEGLNPELCTINTRMGMVEEKEHDRNKNLYIMDK